MSRTNTNVDPHQGEYNDFLGATLKGCGPDQTVFPPRDVQICGGQLHEAVSDGGGQSTLAMYPKQPFDIAGRTGTVVFDVGNDSDGSHEAWPEFWWTDQPVPAPGGDLPANTAHARNSFGFTMVGGSDGRCPTGQWGVGLVKFTRNYAYTEQGPATTGCVGRGSPAALNHVKVLVSATRIEVWATDPGASTFRQIATLNAAAPLTRGVVWLEDVHYNGCKFSNQCNHTFVWDNLGFDGPKPYRDLGFDYPDAKVLHNGRLGLGYLIGNGATRLFNIGGVHSDQTPTGGLVMFNFVNGNGVAVAPQVRVNGGPWHTMSWQWAQPTPSNWCGWCPVAVPVALSEVRDGVNAVEIKAGDDIVISNLTLVLIAAAPVP